MDISSMNLHTFILISFLLITVGGQENCSIFGHQCNAYLINGTVKYPNYADLRAPQLIQLFGYPVEVHNIVTEDGYILTAHRIPYSNTSNATTGKIPVFLLHGIFSSSAQWFWQPPNRALVFMLADAGYDVWIGNTRGTTYSTGSTTFDPNDPQDLRFWNFSQHEMGKYDIPAIINYITNTTEQPSIYYIGHSMGTQQFFIGLTLNPNLKPKIRTFFGLAPIAFMGNVTNRFFRAAAPLYSQDELQQIANVESQGRFLPPFLQNRLGDLLNYCDISAIECSACSYVLLLVLGIDYCQTNFTSLPGLLAHEPDTVSSKTFSHMMQFVQNGQFKEYDYGPIGNIAAYGQIVAPDYNLSNFNVPSVLVYADNDNIAVPMDIRKTTRALGSNVKEIVKVPYRAWNHLDFVTAKDADIYVYNRIIDIMNSRLYG